MVTSKDIIKRINDGQISEKDICTVYCMYLEEAQRMNPMRPWAMRSFPTKEDLIDVITCLPPNVCQEIEDMFFP